MSTRTIRLSQDAYLTMRKLKSRMEKRNGAKFSYSAYLDELNKVAELLLDGQELYVVDGEMFDDQSVAWGEAVLKTAKGTPTVPDVYLYLGQDQDYQLPEVAP